MPVRFIEVRQPKSYDLVGPDFVIAGYASGYEGVVLWRVLDSGGTVLAEDKLSRAGSMGTIIDFGERLSSPNFVGRGKRITLQVFGEDATGENPIGPDLNQVQLTLFGEMTGWTLHEVVPGDTLNKIAAAIGFGGATAEDVHNANRDVVSNPNVIFPGQVLRIPQFA